MADDPATDDDGIEPDATAHEPGSVAVPAGAHGASLLTDAHRFDRMVEFNPAVQQAIRRWLTDLRGPFLTSYENYLGMRALMLPAFDTWNSSASLFACAMTAWLPVFFMKPMFGLPPP